MASSLVCSVSEAAELLGQSPMTIYRAIDTGLLPELPRLSNRRVIPRAAIDRMVDAAMEGFDPTAALAGLRAAS